MPAVVPFIPLIAQGVGLVGGAIAGKKATKSAMQRSPEEMQSLTGAQGVAGTQAQTGASLLKEGQPWVQQPANYYQALLSGDRAKMSQAVAAPTAQLTQQARGEERSLERSGVRGAARDVASADISRRRASGISGLTTGVQPYAAQQLSSLGQQHLQTGGQMQATAGNIYGNLLGKGTENRQYGRLEGEKTSAAIGKLAAMAGQTLSDVYGDKDSDGGDIYQQSGVNPQLSGLPTTRPTLGPFGQQRNPWLS